ncbi:ABC transporter ATP-binding protein [filamentous cyanobacterium LEGE 11480]|uniref:ABC transporter ATP-binding protein n=1 Tax=Romeriopsis navalis LEGE 11480 TaxID=2777977 RepID=A0A928VVV6_9CYAN|nr:ABC transporter ATP-binding protein [Romeriopsis navalis]MBE9033442.1 ABC transporter ATP-binding protein [Romeriopsis navalis LEGE 11480]
MPILNAQNLQKCYKTHRKSLMAVKDVSLQLAAGEVLAFLGPNGAGKTTSIKMIAGLIQPDQGNIRILDLDPHREPEALKHLGAVLEGNRNLYWRLTPEENLEYFGVLRGLTRKQARQQGRRLLDRFELNHKRKETIQKLSRGMQQKVAIAVAMVHDPKLLLLDEPTLGLDVEATETVKRLVREIASEGRGIVLTTHQLDVAEALSDRVAIINQGSIVTEKPTHELINQFSSSTYRIALEEELDSDRDSKLEYLGITVTGKQITLNNPELLYTVLDILRPLPIVKVEKDQANLTDVFLQVVQAGRNA